MCPKLREQANPYNNLIYLYFSWEKCFPKFYIEQHHHYREGMSCDSLFDFRESWWKLRVRNRLYL